MMIELQKKVQISFYIYLYYLYSYFFRGGHILVLDLGNIRVAPPRFRRENLIASESTRFNRPLSIQTGSPAKQYDARI